MNWVDLSLITIVAVSAMLAFMRGLVREVLGVGAWIGAAWFAYVGFDFVRDRFRGWIGNPDLADPAAYGALFLGALILLSIVIGMVGKLVNASMLGGIDRTLGIVFGVARGMALIVVAYIGAGWVVTAERWPKPVQQARLLPYVYDAARWAAAQLPEAYRPNVTAPPAGREATAADLLHVTPSGRARP